MTTETQLVVKAFVWNEGQAPVEVVWEGPVNFDRIQAALAEKLTDFEFGKITNCHPGKERALYYRAWTDPYRGRQIISGADSADLAASYAALKRQCEAQVFSPKELYALKPTEIDYCSLHVIRTHITEIDSFDLDYDAIERTRNFEYRRLVYYSADGRRTWELGTVWFENQPVMVVNSSGRDGDEYHDRWITNAFLYGAMVRWLSGFSKTISSDSVVSWAEKIPAMTEFYGSTIHDFYDVDKQELKK